LIIANGELDKVIIIIMTQCY